MDDPNEPFIFQKGSLKMFMEPGTYLYCTCGRTMDQPFCDMTHLGSSFLPEKVVITEPKLVKWCMCRHSAEGHWCDNKHREL